MIPETTSSGSKGFVPHPGGAIYNTAIALGRLDTPAGMLTVLSNDIFGKQLCQGLEASNVNIDHVIFSDRPTTLAFVQLIDGQASYSFFDENSAVRMFDPNVRTNFVDDADCYGARIIKIMSLADIVKVSDEDLDWIIKSSGPLEQKAKSIFDHGASLVILTQGIFGATAYLKAGMTVHVPAEKADVIDTVGAGDTFNAGVLSKLSELGLLQKASLPRISANAVEQALQFGASVAGVTVSRAGANPPWPDEL